jgi:FG-GAP-like repeat
MSRRLRIAGAALLACLIYAATARAHIEAPYTLGKVIFDSTNVCVMVVTKVDKQQNTIIYQKVRDLKGTHPQQTIKHIIRAELIPGEIKAVMDWAEVGKTAIFFHNGGASETCTGVNWYQAYPQGEWWSMSHGEGGLLRSFVGKPEKLSAAVTDIVSGKEVLVPCFANGDRKDWINRNGRVQRAKASLKLLEYNEKRDFAGWGGEDIRRVAGMPGFSQFAALGRTDAEAQSVSVIDFDGDGKPDILLAGSSRVVLIQNQGDSFGEIALPGLVGGCRSAVWADYNGDGKPDLLLATPTGPKLYTNLGKGQFRDDSAVLPQEPCYNLTAAAWIDADGDGKPDILLANGFHGLRLYRNKITAEARAKMTPPKLGDWHYIGPFPNPGGQGFNTEYPPEKEIDLKKQYDGKGGEKAIWKKGNFPDGNVNNLALFQGPNNQDAAAYVYREIEASGPTELPISLGSDDTLTVWLNGEKLLAENVARPCAPDQNRLTLKLKPGKNTLLMKICQGSGEWAFYFSPGAAAVSLAGGFEDVSAQWGLGAARAAEHGKGDTLAVADVNGDARPDFLYGSGQGMLFINTGTRFEPKADSGISYKPSKVGPVFVDFDQDGHADLFVPQNGRCKLFRNDGTGRFTDVSDRTGDLAKPMPGAVSAAWGDFNNDGHLDVVIGCLHGVNRYFEAVGDGTFVEKTDEIGLSQRIFNTQALALADLNGDGHLDLVLNNEGQDAAVLFASAQAPAKRTPLLVQLPEENCWVGGKVRALDGGGKAVQTCVFSGGDGRGGQSMLCPRFTLAPGAYRIELTDSAGQKRVKDVQVQGSPLRIHWADNGPPTGKGS